MTSVPERLAAAYSSLPFVQLPERWEGGSPLNIPGLAAGLPIDDPWDVVTKTSAPGLSGDEMRFAVTGEGRTIAGEDASLDALEPLARAVAVHLEAPEHLLGTIQRVEITAAGNNSISGKIVTDSEHKSASLVESLVG